MPQESKSKKRAENFPVRQSGRKILRTVIFCGAAVLILVYLLPRNQTQKQIKTEKLVLVLDFGDKTKTFQTYLSEQKRAWSLLQQVAAISEMNLEAGDNFSPKKIDGKENGQDNKKWTLYVDGKKQDASSYDVMVKPPAKVTFKFE